MNSKLAIFKSQKQNLRESVSYANNISMSSYTDKHIDSANKGV